MRFKIVKDFRVISPYRYIFTLLSPLVYLTNVNKPINVNRDHSLMST